MGHRDWLVDGKQHYGDGLYREAERILGIPQSSLRIYKSMSERFELFISYESKSNITPGTTIDCFSQVGRLT